jgi:APA family basic amino acid/polyamine antiporter
VFADWLFFGLTAGALIIVRARGDAGDVRQETDATASVHIDARLQPAAIGTTRIASTPGHPWTTLAFVAVAGGIVVNSFFAYPTQSLIGSAILATAAVVFVVMRLGTTPIEPSANG